MRQRKAHERSDNANKQPAPTAPSKFDEHGLQPESVHDYRGRESYEQQRDEGDGGRSGMCEQTDEAERRDPTGSAPTKAPIDTSHPERPRRTPRAARREP